MERGRKAVVYYDDEPWSGLTELDEAGLAGHDEAMAEEHASGAHRAPHGCCWVCREGEEE